MARWWELSIPVAGTLAGGGLGAWLQGRNSHRIFKAQAEREDAHRAEEARRAAYGQFRFKAVEAMHAAQDHAESPDGGERARLAKKAQGLVAECFEIHAALVFLSPPEVVRAAARVGAGLEANPFDMEEVKAAIRAFSAAAREDLGLPELEHEDETDLDQHSDASG